MNLVFTAPFAVGRVRCIQLVPRELAVKPGRPFSRHKIRPEPVRSAYRPHRAEHLDQGGHIRAMHLEPFGLAKGKNLVLTSLKVCSGMHPP